MDDLYSNKIFSRKLAMMLDKIIELENVFYDCVVCHMTQYCFVSCPQNLAHAPQLRQLISF